LIQRPHIGETISLFLPNGTNIRCKIIDIYIPRRGYRNTSLAITLRLENNSPDLRSKIKRYLENVIDGKERME
jgi:hypothetical protein